MQQAHAIIRVVEVSRHFPIFSEAPGFAAHHGSSSPTSPTTNPVPITKGALRDKPPNNLKQASHSKETTVVGGLHQ
jgi:hypothetical protein